MVCTLSWFPTSKGRWGMCCCNNLKGFYDAIVMDIQEITTDRGTEVIFVFMVGWFVGFACEVKGYGKYR